MAGNTYMQEDELAAAARIHQQQRQSAEARPPKPNLERPQLRTRQPTKLVPPPFVLLEGEEKAGKTWAAVQLTASDKVDACYFLDLGEGTADEYGAIPGAAFEVLVHDGTYASVLEQVLAVRAEAAAAHAAGRKPVVLIVDSMTDVWDGLKDWVGERAKASRVNQQKLAQDPAAELTVPRNLWNDAGNRYRRLMNALLTFPGIVVATAKGKPVSDTDPATGQPYKDGRKTYRVEGEKNLAYQATIWVRMTRDGKPLVVGARSVHAGVKPGADEPMVVTNNPDNLVEWLVFDALRYDPAAGATREVQNLRGGELTDDEKADEEATEARQQPPQQRRQQQAPPPRPTLQEARQAVLDRRQARAAGRAESGLPAVRKGQAHAWDAAGEVMPRGTQAERTKLVEDTLAGLNKTTANATPDEWHAAAEELEAEADRRLAATYTEETK